MRFDIWQGERERAEVQANGMRVLRYENVGRRLCAAVWNPKALKPSGPYSFKNAEQRDEWITRQIQAFDDHQARKAQYRKQRTEGDASLADPGAVFCYSWGYEQTNVEYFQVVERHGLMVTLAEIGSESVPGSGYSHGMADNVRPAVDKFLMRCANCKHSRNSTCHGEHIPEAAKERYGCPCREYTPERILHKKRLYFYDGKPSVSFDFGCGSLVPVMRFGNAEPMAVGSHYRSWYA